MEGSNLENTTVDQGMFAEDFYSDDKDLVFQDGSSVSNEPQSPQPQQNQQSQQPIPNQGQNQQQNNVNQSQQLQNQQNQQVQPQQNQQPEPGAQNDQANNQPSPFDFVNTDNEGNQQFDADAAFIRVTATKTGSPGNLTYGAFITPM